MAPRTGRPRTPATPGTPALGARACLARRALGLALASALIACGDAPPPRSPSPSAPAAPAKPAAPTVAGPVRDPASVDRAPAGAAAADRPDAPAPPPPPPPPEPLPLPADTPAAAGLPDAGAHDRALTRTVAAREAAARASEAHELGRTLLALGARTPIEAGATIECLEEAVAGRPDDVTAIVDLADAYLAAGVEETVAAAIALYEAAAARRPDDDRLAARLVEGYARLGNFEEALVQGERRAASPACDAAGTAGQLVWVTLLHGDLARGTAAVRRLVASGRGGGDAQAYLAVLLRAAGRRDEAEAALAAAEAALPPTSPLRAVLAGMHAGGTR
ncbi:MAG: hypothetical protein IT460_02350 [Planctomycetes bacterium]|nr:hypothetical protein [Planctomycetota bacterium]